MTQSPSTPPTSPMDQGVAFDAGQRQRDLEHLKMLAILHYVFGGLSVLGGCAGIIYVVLGIAMIADPSTFDNGAGNNPPPPEWLGTMLLMFGGCLMLVVWTLAGLIIYAGRCLASQRRRVFCMVVAGVMCLSIPLGTLLGIFTLIVLSRPSVMALFQQRLMAPMIAMGSIAR